MSFTKKTGARKPPAYRQGSQAVETPPNTVAIRPRFANSAIAKATQNSGGLSGSFLFEGNRDGRVRRQPDLLAFDLCDQPQIDEMMMAFVTSFAAIGLGELDPATFNAIDGSDVNAVRADYFHVLLYGHFKSPPSCWRLSPGELVALPGQKLELSFLFGDAPRRQLLVRRAGIGGGLLDQFADVFPCRGDALLDLREVQRNVSHG